VSAGVRAVAAMRRMVAVGPASDRCVRDLVRLEARMVPLALADVQGAAVSVVRLGRQVTCPRAPRRAPGPPRRACRAGGERRVGRVGAGGVLGAALSGARGRRRRARREQWRVRGRGRDGGDGNGDGGMPVL
jgi:hypothetical protein